MKETNNNQTGVVKGSCEQGMLSKHFRDQERHLSETVRSMGQIIKASTSSTMVQVPLELLQKVVRVATKGIPLQDALERAGMDNLLKEYTKGWRLLKKESGIFLFYSKKNEIRVEFSPKLKQVRDRLLRGHSEISSHTHRIEDALLLIAHAYGLHPNIKSEKSPDCGFEKHAFWLLVDTLGPDLVNVIASNNPRAAEKACDAAFNSLQKAMRGLFRMNHRERSLGGGEDTDRALVAQFFACSLCRSLKRHPSKAELQNMMETCGYAYAEKSKDIRGKFSSLFERAGLGSLVD